MSMIETAAPSPLAVGSRLGERVRALRVSAGLTQTELAGERFSKEYISQIERGKTRPTDSTITWLADRLGVDAALLSSGVSTEERTKVEAMLARAEALSEAHQYEEAIEAFREARPRVDETGAALDFGRWPVSMGTPGVGRCAAASISCSSPRAAERSDSRRRRADVLPAGRLSPNSSTSTAIALFGGRSILLTPGFPVTSPLRHLAAALALSSSAARVRRRAR
jgi:transcriptional regulator with XRE-family HTH domain